GYVEIVRMNPALDAETVESLNQIAAASQRGAGLTRQLLTFSRRQVMQPTALDLNTVVGNVAKMLRRIIGEDISLQLNYAPNSARILADENMLGQVLMNLTINARDAMPRGGKLAIT